MFVEQKVFTGPPVLAVAPTSFFAASEDSAVPTTGRRASLKDSVSHVGPAVGTDTGTTVNCHKQNKALHSLSWSRPASAVGVLVVTGRDDVTMA